MSTLSPRSMNLMATCWPVLLSSASSTKPNVPLFKSLICRRAHMELSTVTTPYNMHPVMTAGKRQAAQGTVSRHPAGVRRLQRGPGVPEVCRLLTPLLQGNPV